MGNEIELLDYVGLPHQCERRVRGAMETVFIGIDVLG